MVVSDDAMIMMKRKRKRKKKKKKERKKERKAARGYLLLYNTGVELQDR